MKFIHAQVSLRPGFITLPFLFSFSTFFYLLYLALKRSRFFLKPFLLFPFLIPIYFAFEPFWFYSRVLFLEFSLRLLRLNYAYACPKTHLGSLDGDFIWATLLTSTPIEELSFWMILKHIQISLFAISVLMHRFFHLNHPIHSVFANINLVWFWIRRILLLGSLFTSKPAPWLLWLPDFLVLLAAFLFDFGLFTGLALTQQSKSKSATNPHLLKPKQAFSFELEKEWYHQFLFGSFEEEDVFDDAPYHDVDTDHLLSDHDSSDTDSDSDLQLELDELLKEAVTDELDESYVYPNHAFTRNMRKSVATKTFQKSRIRQPSLFKVKHFRQALLNPSSAVSKMVESVLIHRRSRNENQNRLGLLCVICRDQMRDIILLPCRHLCLCASCKEQMDMKKLDTCPVCSELIEENVKIYWS